MPHQRGGRFVRASAMHGHCTPPGFLCQYPVCTVSLDFGLFLILHITKGYNFVKCTNTKCITQKVLLNFAKYEEKMLTQFRVFY